MFTPHHLFVASFACISLLFLSGRESPELPTSGGQGNFTTASPPSKVPQQSSAEVEAHSDVLDRKGSAADLRDVIDTWHSGAQDQAVGKLLLIDWGTSTASGDIPAMSITEDEFTALPPGERAKQQAAAM